MNLYNSIFNYDRSLFFKKRKYIKNCYQSEKNIVIRFFRFVHFLPVFLQRLLIHI